MSWGLALVGGPWARGMGSRVGARDDGGGVGRRRQTAVPVESRRERRGPYRRPVPRIGERAGRVRCPRGGARLRRGGRRRSCGARRIRLPLPHPGAHKPDHGLPGGGEPGDAYAVRARRTRQFARHRRAGADEARHRDRRHKRRGGGAASRQALAAPRGHSGRPKSAPRRRGLVRRRAALRAHDSRQPASAGGLRGQRPEDAAYGRGGRRRGARHSRARHPDCPRCCLPRARAAHALRHGLHRRRPRYGGRTHTDMAVSLAAAGHIQHRAA